MLCIKHTFLYNRKVFKLPIRVLCQKLHMMKNKALIEFIIYKFDIHKYNRNENKGIILKK